MGRSVARFWNPDRTVRSDRKNLEPFNFSDFFSLKNHSMEKKNETRANRGRTSRFWEPWSDRFSRFPTTFESKSLKKIKKKKKKQQQQQQ